MEKLNMFNINREIISPLSQFEIRDLLSLTVSFLNNTHISLTNIALYLILASVLTLSLHLFTNNNLTLLSSK